MDAEFYPGRRLSFDNERCTVRYVGEVAGTKGQWLGVEWDDPSRGKHSGTHGGVKYFDCKSKSNAAGSFVRPNRPSDHPLSFTDALQIKYVSDLTSAALDTEASLPEDLVIQISGKEIEEVGFDKVQKQISNLRALRILILDEHRVNRPSARIHRNDEARTLDLVDVQQTCPLVKELDLSRNLFEDWSELVDICRQLPELGKLSVDGNRFKVLDHVASDASQDFASLKSLSLDDTFVTWEDLEKITTAMPALVSLSLAGNQMFHVLTNSLPTNLTTLNLERNDFDSLAALYPVSKLNLIQRLSLKDNNISRIVPDSASPMDVSQFPKFSQSLIELDLSLNQITDWGFVDKLGIIFPGMTSLRIAHNPLYESYRSLEQSSAFADDGFILTIARLGRLSMLNSSQITAKERFNAETFYMSQIAKEMAATDEEHRATFISAHSRYHELCSIYGEPEIQMASPAPINPNSLAARLVKVTFAIDKSLSTLVNPEKAAYVREKIDMELPRSLTIYNVLGILGKKLGAEPMFLQLVWHTGEEDLAVTKFDLDTGETDALIQLREEILKPQTRSLGSWLEHSTAVVRVETNKDEVARCSCIRW